MTQLSFSILITHIVYRLRLMFPRFIVVILCLNLIFILLIHQLFTARPTLSIVPILFKYRLRPQNNSIYHFVKFRNLDTLIDHCENTSTIECLNYLYQNQLDYFERLSLNELKTFQNKYCHSKKKLLFHTFWDDPHQLNDVLLQLHIKSYLYTQNRQCSNMIIWTLPTFYNNNQIDQKFKTHEPYLQIRTILPFTDDLHQVGIHIGSHWTRLPWRWFLPRLSIVSDAVRFIILNKLGGIYVDADVLLLRDFQPLFTHEFAYRWSFTNEFNTAVLRLFPQSNTTSIIMNNARKEQSPYVFYPTSITLYRLPTSFKRLPCAFFDPLWLAADNKDQKAIKIWKLTKNGTETFATVFKQENEISRHGRTVFNGAFALHWHALKRINTFQDASYLHQWNEFLSRELYDDYN